MDPYWFWDDLGNKPAPAGVSPEVWWAALKLSRSPRMHQLPLCDRQGRAFRFCLPDPLIERLHGLDLLRGAPEIESGEFRRLAAKARACEAIASARLAGAEISDEPGREMLRAGRSPQGDGERMAANLHRALELTGDWLGRDLDPDRMMELHRIALDGLPDRAPAAGSGQAEPPPGSELPGRLEPVCAFANEKMPDTFIHPLVRAAVLHCWIARARPFPDGNGRIARIVFRWAMLRQGYPRFDLLAPSAALAAAPRSYADSLARTEDDDNDVTYFILNQAEAMGAAERALQDDLRRAAEYLRQAGRRLPALAELNPRQQALMAHALRHPATVYTIAGHQRSHGVTHQTARDDLFALERRGLLSVSRERRIYRFRAAGGPPHTASGVEGQA